MDSFATPTISTAARSALASRVGSKIRQMNLEASLRVALGTTSEDLSINGGQLRTFPNGATVVLQRRLIGPTVEYRELPPRQVHSSSRNRFQIEFPDLQLPDSFDGLFRSLLESSSSLRGPDRPQRRCYADSELPRGGGVHANRAGTSQRSLHQSDLWVVGISIGAEFRW